MPIIQWEFPFTCPKCKNRISRSRIDNTCLRCGENILKVANRSNTILPIIPLHFFIGMIILIHQLFQT